MAKKLKKKSASRKGDFLRSLAGRRVSFRVPEDINRRTGSDFAETVVCRKEVSRSFAVHSSIFDQVDHDAGIQIDTAH